MGRQILEQAMRPEISVAFGLCEHCRVLFVRSELDLPPRIVADLRDGFGTLILHFVDAHAASLQTFVFISQHPALHNADSVRNMSKSLTTALWMQNIALYTVGCGKVLGIWRLVSTSGIV